MPTYANHHYGRSASRPAVTRCLVCCYNVDLVNTDTPMDCCVWCDGWNHSNGPPYDESYECTLFTSSLGKDDCKIVCRDCIEGDM